MEKIIAHPEYDHETVDYDIALIKLQSPAKLNDYVTPACLPSNTDNLNQTFPPGLNCEVSGWGSINPNIDDEEERKFGPVLKHDKAVSLSLLHSHPCFIYEANMRHIRDKYEAIMKQISIIFQKMKWWVRQFSFIAKPL